MKKAIFFLCFITSKLFSQGTAGFFDDRGFFFTYMNGSISKQEIIPIEKFYPSINYIAYIDRNGNFKIVHRHKKYTIFPIRPDTMAVSNYLMAYSQGLQLGVFNGQVSKKVETFTTGSFKLGDSVLAYIDNFENLKVYVYDSIYTLMNFAHPEQFHVSDNIVAFQTRDNKFKIFTNHEISEVEDIMPLDFKLGRSIIAYNDFQNNFKVFAHGEKKILESYPITQYEVYNEFLTYFTNVNQWMAYSSGEPVELLSTFPKSKVQKRNMLAYADNANNFYLYYKGKKIQIENYLPTKYEIWDDLLVYEDMYRVLWGIYHGEKIQISAGIVKGDWEMQRSTVVYYDLTPNTKTVWSDKKLYQYSEEFDLGKR